MIASPFYTIRPRYWHVEDKPGKGYDHSSLLFHISSDDYFGTLATALSLLRETIKDGNFQGWHLETLRHATRDLKFLQENYKIVSKPRKNTGND